MLRARLTLALMLPLLLLLPASPCCLHSRSRPTPVQYCLDFGVHGELSIGIMDYLITAGLIMCCEVSGCLVSQLRPVRKGHELSTTLHPKCMRTAKTARLQKGTSLHPSRFAKPLKRRECCTTWGLWADLQVICS